jgi:hypothetical protein
MTNAPTPKNSAAYMVQAGLAFGVALVTMVVGELQLPVDTWTRAFLALGTVFLVSSAFTLAKCIRDQQESGTVVSRIDQARLDRLLAEFDPFHVTPLPNSTHQPMNQPSHPMNAPMNQPMGPPPAAYPAPFERVG